MENDYKVVDMDLAEFGRKEISLAENEMPALMALRDKYREIHFQLKIQRRRWQLLVQNLPTPVMNPG